MTPEASPDPSIPTLVQGIAVRMADEGIPVRAIARACQHPSDEVREVLHDAKDRGLIAEMPRDDWPPTARRADRLPVLAARRMSDDEVTAACMRTFRLTKLQATLLSVLLKRGEVEKPTLHHAIEHLRSQRTSQPSNLEETDQKMVDVVICHIRKKLRPFSLEIKTLWSRGYYMERDQRALAFKKFDEYDMRDQEMSHDEETARA